MKQQRKQYTGEEKVGILRKHLLEGVPVSDVCDEYGLQPAIFYRWQKQFFEQGAEVFRCSSDRETTQLKREVVRLKEKLTKKDKVLGELMEEYVALKKALGAP